MDNETESMLTASWLRIHRKLQLQILYETGEVPIGYTLAVLHARFQVFRVQTVD